MFLIAVRSLSNTFQANSVTSSWNGLKAAAQKGMQNITGALCYRNSLLQAIFHQPKIVRWLVQTHKLESCTSDDEQKCLCCAVRGLVVAYWREGKVTYEALNNIDAIFHHHGWRAGSRSGQADPDEQATWLFNAMRESLPTSVFSQFEAFMHVGTTSVTCCLKCKHESRKLGDEERCLSLPIAPRVRGGSVEDYLDRYLREFVQDYTCEKCKDNKSQKERDIRIAHAPDVLTIQLKRFDWDGRKDSVHVTINERLDLGDYRDTGNEQSMRYELSAVIKHTGNAVSGHYISAAKGPDGQWCEYNDSFKKIRSLEDVVSGKNFTPYILYYQRMEA
ncbi:hypothetical protein BJ878DRAFT_60549 [Calycina marina]|uniref:ubiquitinyl hydrolase 1 n=1 Tax=Calycina marina TaxID=1763456 RepID=A0A9P7Z3R0_9HELO|nr:hypothetical protein BJ878DRAFT_60549 [Calycina marina]